MTAQNGTGRPPAEPLESCAGVSAEELESLLALVADTEVTELDITIGTTHVSLRRPAGSQLANASVAQPSEAPIGAEPATLAIASPLVGVFRPSVEAGDAIQHGEPIGAIEAFGLPTTVDSPQTGTVEQVLVADGGAVEYGQALVILRRAP